jgi:RNA polymerase sigma-70 factor (ECF subfamily)
LLNTQDAEDTLQDTFVYAFKNLGRYEASRASFKTWLYTIAISRCRNLYRRNRPLAMDISQMIGLSLMGPQSEHPENALATQHLQDRIERALVALSPTLREAVVLRYGHGLRYREIAEVMNCPQKTAESRVRLAHDALRGLLADDAPDLLGALTD